SLSAEHHDRVRFRQSPGPVMNALGIAPDRTIHDVLLAGNVRPRASIDDLDRLAGVQHSLDFLDPNTRQIPELLLDEGSGRLDLWRILIARLCRHPIDVALKRIYVRLRVRPEVNVVGMLVHIESQNRDAPSR